MKEVFRPIIGFAGYEISNMGRVKSLPRTKKTKGGALQWVVGGILKARWNRGYLIVVLRKKPKAIHRMVAEVFVPNPEGKPFVNHKSGDKSDNAFSNLEWVTSRENEDHAVKNGLKARGSRQHLAKLREADIPKIRKWIELHGASWRTFQVVSKNLRVDPKTIQDVWSGRTWRHV